MKDKQKYKQIYNQNVYQTVRNNKTYKRQIFVKLNNFQYKSVI